MLDRFFRSEKEPQDLDFQQMYFEYKKMRTAEALVADCPLEKHYNHSVFSLYGKYYKLHARAKIMAAHKMMMSFIGHIDLLEYDEWKAVTTGRLGKITSAARAANKLHPEFLRQEEAHKSKGKIHYQRPC